MKTIRLLISYSDSYATITLYMCLAIPGKVKSVLGKKVMVQYPHSHTEVYTGGFTLKSGDYVLVQTGIVIQILTPIESASAISAWRKISSN